MSVGNPEFTIWRDRDESGLPRKILIAMLLAVLLVAEGFRFTGSRLIHYLLACPAQAIRKGLKKSARPLAGWLGPWWRQHAMEDAFWLGLSGK